MAKKKVRRRKKAVAGFKFPSRFGSWKQLAEKVKKRDAYAKTICRRLARFIYQKTGIPGSVVSTTQFFLTGTDRFLRNLGKGRKRAEGLKIFREAAQFTEAEIVDGVMELLRQEIPVSWKDVLPRLKDKKLLFQRISSFVSKKAKTKSRALFASTDFYQAGLDAFLRAIGPKRKVAAGVDVFREVMAFSEREIAESVIRELEEKEAYISWGDVLSRIKDKKYFYRRLRQFCLQESSKSSAS